MEEKLDGKPSQPSRVKRRKENEKRGDKFHGNILERADMDGEQLL